MNKIIFTIIGFLVVLQIFVWVFNHVNAWIGISGFIITLIVLINYFKKSLKDETKSKN